MNRKVLYSLLGVIVSGFFACDKIEGPYKETIGFTGDTSQHVRKILVEDYTGHTCGNCPQAAIAAKEVKQLYGNQVVVMAVHTGFYAQPKSYPDGSYANDYRTPAGNDYSNFFGNDKAGLPNGMVNRKSVNASRILNHKDWAGMAQGIVTLPPEADITVSNTYDSLTRNVNTIVRVQYLKPLSSAYRLVVCVTEDSIVSWQKDYTLPSPSNNPTYMHRHMLRGTVNSSWGDTLSGGLPGAVSQKIYNHTLNTAWKAKHCSIVAFLYDAATYEVIQAEEKHIQ